MRQAIVFVIGLMALVASAVPVVGGTGNKCSPAGTWYGGSDATKYLMTISPRGGNSYSVAVDGAYTLGGIGVEANTNYRGEMVKSGPRLYRGRMISILSYYGDPPPTPISALEIDAVSGFMELTSCHELTSTINYFVAYFGWGAEPFVDEPDIDLLDLLNGGQPIVETYQRISMAPMD
jgi:hypothetical protein